MGETYEALALAEEALYAAKMRGVQGLTADQATDLVRRLEERVESLQRQLLEEE